MVTFCFCLCLLILGFFLHSRFIESRFGLSDRQTPAFLQQDGVDYIPMPGWRVFLIEFLNIAGLGPIFGALAGALWGPIALLWVTFGTIFIGAVHDYFSGMISVRCNGATLGEIFGIYFGKKARKPFQLLTILPLILVGVVFAAGPANLLVFLFEQQGQVGTLLVSSGFWLAVIFLYYFLASYLSVDKIIGKIYPFFGFALLFMGFGVFFGVINRHAMMPELWSWQLNMHPKALPIFPFLFITIACGAISGFHATQSPLAARCLISEKMGRPVFAGSMYAEGLVALIWASAGCALYEITDGQTLALASIVAHGQAAAVYDVCLKTLGPGAVALAILGVIVCPITTGDTAFRAARMGLEELFGLLPQDNKGRIFTSAGVIGVGVILSQLDFDVLWRYFAWFNQTLAACTLWLAAVHQMRQKRKHYSVSLPAIFMTCVSVTYFLLAPECLGRILKLDYSVGVGLGVLVTVFVTYGMFKKL